MSLNKIKLNIAGANYTINSMDSEAHVMELAQTLDTDMRKILDQSPSASVTAAAVLCAMTYLDKVDRSSKGADNMRLQIKQYLEDANKARFEAEKVKVELEKLKVDIQYLKNQRGGNEK
ncbi:MAG: cell division protein ZapA [Oscillospiraceae bacterium]